MVSYCERGEGKFDSKVVEFPMLEVGEVAGGIGVNERIVITLYVCHKISRTLECLRT